jgi:amino acid transporter
MSLVDLVSVGVGGTIGSGIFVLTGLIAHHYAGPSTFVSFILSGFAASCSGLCYAEWAGRLPAAGSTYVYAYVSLGEWAAVIAGACLTLEFGVSGAAVARSWGDKVVEYLTIERQWESAAAYLGGEYFNPLAGFISALSVVILSCGVQESKAITNIFTLLKVLLVLFMIVGGFLFFDTKNMTPLVPFGTTGILRGATSSFFGYLGYDEVCCLASEAKNPADMPRAVLWTLATVTVLYIMASIALVGMVPYENISDTSGFPAAFATVGVSWAAELTAAGEIFTLPVVVLISLLAQPRLCAAMAHDGLLPEIFGRTNNRGNLFWSNILCGVPMAILATVVPFSYLDDCISVGILVAFNMTNSSLILMKCQSPSHASPNYLSQNMIIFHILAFASGMASHVTSPTRKWIPLGFVAVIIAFAIRIHHQCPPHGSFGGSLLQRQDSSLDLVSTGNDTAVFQTPLMPLLPLLGIAMNWYLIAQLEWSGLVLLVVYLGIVSMVYMCFGGNKKPWGHHYDRVHERDEPILLREISLPKR